MIKLKFSAIDMSSLDLDDSLILREENEGIGITHAANLLLYNL